MVTEYPGSGTQVQFHVKGFIQLPLAMEVAVWENKAEETTDKRKEKSKFFFMIVYF